MLWVFAGLPSAGPACPADQHRVGLDSPKIPSAQELLVFESDEEEMAAGGRERRWSVHGGNSGWGSGDESGSGEDGSDLSFIVSDDDDSQEVEGELGQLLSKMRRGGGGVMVQDSDEESQGESQEEEEQENDDDDDEGSPGTSSIDGLGGMLAEMTNLAITTPSRTPAKPSKAVKAAAGGESPSNMWKLENVAAAVRANGRALGLRTACQISSSLWSRHRKRLTKEIFADLNAVSSCAISSLHSVVGSPAQSVSFLL